MPLHEFTKEFIVPEFKIDPSSEYIYFTSYSNEVQDLIDLKTDINTVRKNSKRGYLVMKVISQEENQIPKEDRVFLSYA